MNYSSHVRSDALSSALFAVARRRDARFRRSKHDQGDIGDDPVARDSKDAAAAIAALSTIESGGIKLVQLIKRIENAAKAITR